MPTNVVAHRGLHDQLPENSVAAMLAAWEAGIVWCECDMHLSRDGIAVLMHDSTMSRMTESRGQISEFTWEQLRTVRLRKTTHTVASLQQVLEAMPGDRGMLIEVKPILNDQAGQMLADLVRPHKKVVVQSFHEENLHLMARVDPGINLAWLIERDLEPALRSPWPAINVEHRILDETGVRRLRSLGKSVGAWTVNQDQDLARMKTLGLDILITDRPLDAIA